jgi:nucleotide-binding universal stress UspA family protein
VDNIVDIEGGISKRLQSWQCDGEERFRTDIRRIMVPTDLTGESDRAIGFGIALAKQLGAHLTLLHVYQDPYYVLGYALGPQGGDPAPQIRRNAKHTFESLAKSVRRECPECRFEFRDGVPIEEIVRTAKEREIDLIVISTHPCNCFTRLIFGCDAEEIIRDAPCPVLILHE